MQAISIFINPYLVIFLMRPFLHKKSSAKRTVGAVGAGYADIQSDAKRMSFVFPGIFYMMLCNLRERYKKDMTYIIMEAVNEWVMKKEHIMIGADGIPVLCELEDGNNGKEKRH